MCDLKIRISHSFFAQATALDSNQQNKAGGENNPATGFGYQLGIQMLTRIALRANSPELLDDVIGLLVRVEADLDQFGSVVLIVPAVNDQICKVEDPYGLGSVVKHQPCQLKSIDP